MKEKIKRIYDLANQINALAKKDENLVLILKPEFDEILLDISTTGIEILTSTKYTTLM